MAPRSSPPQSGTRPGRPPAPDSGRPGADRATPPAWQRFLPLIVGIGISAWLLFGGRIEQESATTLPYSGLVSKVGEHQVSQVQIDPDGRVTGRLSDGTLFHSQVPTALGPTDLASRLEAAGTKVEATGPHTSWGAVVLSVLPTLFFLGLFLWAGRRASGAMGMLGNLGRGRVKVIDTERPSTRFADVAGYEGVKREVGEVIEFLRHPDRYRRVGAVGPRGVLMVGPPGTGKTYLARAIAGEAEVPFLSVTGSGFVEMFVGVGAARVRDLFKQARQLAPAIIFIDEIDAIGQRRGGALVANDEREQTINQLLAEMDGFDPAEGVVVLAATNRPEVLDPALLRPGRFDRQVPIPLPTQSERAAILAIHCRGKRLDPKVNLEVVARATPGFSGADLKNLANEAAINAVREGREVVVAADFDAARDRIILGLRDASNALLPEERRAVAVHEGGHALVAALSDAADPVAKVTILPSGQALGATHQLPLDERHLFSETYLRTSLAVRLAGRAAELVVFGEGSTGAGADLIGATDLAGRMVREFGLSPKIGPVGYGTVGPTYLGPEQVTMRSYSEDTQRAIDEEVARLLREAEDQAITLLTEHRTELDRLVGALLDDETIDGALVYSLVGRGAPGPSTGGPVAQGSYGVPVVLAPEASASAS